MTKIDDGGRAFPQLEIVDGERDGHGDLIDAYTVASGGMSLRDWFAGQADQPGAAEIVSTAGLVYSASAVWTNSQERICGFDEWWRSKTNKERFALCAAVRYAYADAMLAARKKGPSDE